MHSWFKHVNNSAKIRLKCLACCPSLEVDDTNLTVLTSRKENIYRHENFWESIKSKTIFTKNFLDGHKFCFMKQCFSGKPEYVLGKYCASLTFHSHCRVSRFVGSFCSEKEASKSKLPKRCLLNCKSDKTIWLQSASFTLRMKYWTIII